MQLSLQSELSEFIFPLILSFSSSSTEHSTMYLWWKVPLPMARVWNKMVFKVHFRLIQI